VYVAKITGAESESVEPIGTSEPGKSASGGWSGTR